MHTIARSRVWPVCISAILVLLLAVGYRSFSSLPMEPALVGYWNGQDDAALPHTPDVIQIAANATALVIFNDDPTKSVAGTITGRELLVTRGWQRSRYHLAVEGDTLTLRDAQTTYVFDRVFAEISGPGLSK